ncbi:MAG: hypothetical protein HQ536_04015, partial [Parcubacteria group bacterium]|nr:hypothetical protein [Parcubacteria group bacterium]
YGILFFLYFLLIIWFILVACGYYEKEGAMKKKLPGLAILVLAFLLCVVVVQLLLYALSPLNELGVIAISATIGGLWGFMLTFLLLPYLEKKGLL